MIIEPDDSGENLSYPLLDNALDFLLSAAEYAGDESARNRKYAILHLVAGIELLLKSRLELEHWSLLFRDADKADKKAYNTGDFQSADFDSVCKRLIDVANVPIPKNERDEIERLRKLRHKVEHFAINIDLAQVKSLLARGLNFAIAFFQKNLKEGVGGSEEELLGAIVAHLHEFQEFVAERLKVAASHVTPGTVLRECPICWQEMLERQENGVFKCHYCAHETDAMTLALIVTEDDVYMCPECGIEALALYIYGDGEGWECFACDMEFDHLKSCSSCGELHGGELPVCDDCFRGFIDHD